MGLRDSVIRHPEILAEMRGILGPDRVDDREKPKECLKYDCCYGKSNGSRNRTICSVGLEAYNTCGYISQPVLHPLSSVGGQK